MLDPRRQTVGHDEPDEAVRGERAADVAVELVGDGGVSPVPSLPGPAEISLAGGIVQFLIKFAIGGVIYLQI